MEPTQDSGPSTTATSAMEGRLKVAAGHTCKSKKCLKCAIRDGKGGPGNMLPAGANSVTDIVGAPTARSASLAAMMPGRGIQPTSNTFSPQQSMQMASQGMMPTGMSSSLTPPGSVARAPVTSSGAVLPSQFARLTNRPHKSSAKTPKMKKLKKLSVKSLVSSAKRPKAKKLVL